MAAHAAIHDFLRDNKDMGTGIRRHDDGRAASRESSFMQAGINHALHILVGSIRLRLTAEVIETAHAERQHRQIQQPRSCQRRPGIGDQHRNERGRAQDHWQQHGSATTIRSSYMGVVFTRGKNQSDRFVEQPN